MITVDIPARIECDTEGCDASCPVKLCLLGTGGFAFQPADKAWQVMLPGGPMGMGSAFRANCPTHKTKLQVGPAGPRMVPAHE